MTINTKMDKRNKNEKKGRPRENAKASAPVEDMEVDPDEDGSDHGDLEEEGGFRLGDIYIPPAAPAQCSVESIGPRLIITHIENEFFKSYAGKTILGPFEKSFTCIVGPNGSGKSNVIDSMLFVFGYRASKIRSKKISVLIHKSEQFTNVRSCTVAVHFALIVDKPNEEFDFVPNSKFVIARTAFADNSSYYTLNGKRVQFKEVAEVLKKHGIDLIHNRFLILQGEVEQIAMMKPIAQSEHDTGLLEYLEDIIGTSRYKEPIQKLFAKVELLSTERTEKQNRLRLVQKEMEGLEAPMLEAVDFLEQSNELSLMKNKLFQKNKYICIKDTEEKNKEKHEIENRLTEVKTNLKQFQSQQTEKQEEIAKLEKECIVKRNKKEISNTKHKESTNKDVSIDEELKHTNEKRRKLMNSKKEEEKKLGTLEELPEKNKKEIEELKKHSEELNTQRQKEQKQVNEVLASLQEETKGFQDKKDKLQGELSVLKNILDEARSKHDLAKSALDIYLSNEQKEKNRLEQLKATLKTTADSLKERKKTLDERQTNLPQAQNELQTATIELKDVRHEENTLTQELLKKRSTLEEKKVAMNANRSRNRVLDFLLKQKEEGHLPGIFGRLGDLGAIDAKYDVAVSTACHALDNIVVDNIKTGEKGVAALKKYNVGRATFIALDKQEHLRQIYTRPMQTPENVPRLFDVIKVADDRVKPAFYYSLRDTLVANDLDQAGRIAYGRVRHRVVTLKGEIIETSGTMSGGGNTVMRGRMGRSVAMITDNVTPGEMDRMENRVKELETRVKSLRERGSVLENTIDTRSRDVKMWTLDINKLKLDVKSLYEQEPSLKDQINRQEERVKEVQPDKKKVSEMTATVESAQKEMEKAESSAGKLEAQVGEVHDQIIMITGGRTKAARKKLDEVIKTADKVTARITKLGVELKTAERNTKKSKEAIKNMTAEIEQIQERMSVLNSEKINNTKEAERNLCNLEEIVKELNALEAILDEKKADFSEVLKKENEFKAQKQEQERILKTLEAKLKDLKDRISREDEKRKKLSLYKIPKKPDTVQELSIIADEELAEVKVDHLRYKIDTLETKLNKLTPNLKIIEDYEAKSEQRNARCKDLDDVTTRRNEMREWHDKVRKLRLNEFIAGFTVITDKLKEMYQMITLGGDAELELVDSLDPFTEGIIFSVRPPKKSWKNISNLSGGEKTLSSLALVFALHYYKPTPLYVMDEIDAALDFKNVSIVGNYIKDRTKNAQFIIISLRSNMFELADRLVGIYKTNNCTHSATITPRLYTRQQENEITDADKVSILLTVVGPKIVSLLEDLIAPEEVDTPYMSTLLILASDS